MSSDSKTCKSAINSEKKQSSIINGSTQECACGVTNPEFHYGITEFPTKAAADGSATIVQINNELSIMKCSIRITYARIRTHCTIVTRCDYIFSGIKH